MAWVAETTFEDNSVATLNGQSGGTGWSGDWGSAGSFNPGNTFVQSTTAYQGSKATLNSGGVSAIYRILAVPIGTSDTGVIYIALRRSSATGTDENNASWRNSGDQSRVNIALMSNGHINLGSGAGLVDLGTYSANTWYVFRLTYDMGAGRVTAAYSTDAYGTAGIWSAESTPFTLINSGAIDHIDLNGGDSNTGYYDYISGVSPFSSKKESMFLVF
jgi:hypothetical protein